MKKSLSLLLALVMVLGTFSSVFAAIPTNADEKAEFLQEVGILKGNASGDLMLEDALKRAHATVLLSRLFGKNDVDQASYSTENMPFTDVNVLDAPFVAWAFDEGYAKGRTATTFDPNGPLTAQEFATFLLRALDYEIDAAAFATAFEKAEGLGILEGLELEVKSQLTRRDMAAMTYNALNVKMRYESETLAQRLKITMPTEDIKVNGVKADNLREVKVELNTLTGLDQKALVNAKNYRTDAGEVKEVSVEENTLVLLLEDGKVMTQNGKYNLTIRDVKGIEGSHAFTAYDNTDPAVAEVVVLGSMGIRIRMTEPVKAADERDFLLDGKTFVSKVTTNGRDITLIPYPYFKTFEKMGEQELTVLAQNDFAGYKSPDFREVVDIKADSTKPVVESIEATNNSVIVTFKNEVYPPSVSASNAKWSIPAAESKGATSAKVLSGKRVEYVFEGANELPRRDVTFTVSGVQNYSAVTMDTHTQAINVYSDYSRPEIISWSLLDDPDTTQAEVRLVFSKDLDADTALNVANYALYTAKEYFPNERVKLLENAVKNGGVRFERGSKNVVIVTFETKTLNRGQNYILNVQGVRDNTAIKNLMIAKDVPFTDGIGVGLVVWSATWDNVKQEVTVRFNDKMLDRKLAEDHTNYRFTTDTIGFNTGNNIQKDFKLSELSNHPKVVLHQDGYTVTISLPGNTRVLTGVRISSSVMTLDGLHRFNGATQCGGALGDNWVGLNQVRNALKAGGAGVKVSEDNKEIELTFNLPLVTNAVTSPASDWKNHVKINERIAAGVWMDAKNIKDVELANGKAYLILKEALTEGTEYQLVLEDSADPANTRMFALTQYGMGVCPTPKEGRTLTFNNQFLSPNAPKITESKVTVDKDRNVIVEVEFDQLMDFGDVNVYSEIDSNNIENLAIENNDNTVRHYFGSADELLAVGALVQRANGRYAGTKVMATFEAGEKAEQLINTMPLPGVETKFNYDIVVDKNRPVKGINGKAIVSGEYAVEELVLEADAFGGKDLTISSKGLKTVRLTGNFGAATITVNVPNADVFVPLGTIVNTLRVINIHPTTLHVAGFIKKLDVAIAKVFNVNGINNVERVVASVEGASINVADYAEDNPSYKKDVDLTKDQSVVVDATGTPVAVEVTETVTETVYNEDVKSTKVAFEVKANDKHVDVDVNDFTVKVNAEVVAVTIIKEDDKYVFLLKGEVAKEDIKVELKK